MKANQGGPKGSPAGQLPRAAPAMGRHLRENRQVALLSSLGSHG